MKNKLTLTALLALTVSLSANANWTYTATSGFQIKTVGPFSQQYECDFARNYDFSDTDGWTPYSECTWNGPLEIDPTYVPIYPGPGGHQTPIIPVFPYPNPLPNCQFIDC